NVVALLEIDRGELAGDLSMHGNVRIGFHRANHVDRDRHRLLFDLSDRYRHGRLLTASPSALLLRRDRLAAGRTGANGERGDDREGCGHVTLTNNHAATQTGGPRSDPMRPLCGPDRSRRRRPWPPRTQTPAPRHRARRPSATLATR